MYFEKCRPHEKRAKRANYNLFVEQFCAANIKFAEVKNFLTATAASTAFGINRAAERNRFPVVAFSDAGHVYIKRTDEMGED